MNEAEIQAAFEQYLQSLGLGHGSATLSTSGVFEYMPFVFQAFRAAYIQQSAKIDQLKFDKEILANTVGAVGDDYENFRSEIERLKDENKALMKDRERLDWLGTWHSEYEVNYRDFGIKLVDPHSDGWALEWDMDKIFKEGNGHNYILITHNTLREAIDAARKAKP